MKTLFLILALLVSCSQKKSEKSIGEEKTKEENDSKEKGERVEYKKIHVLQFSQSEKQFSFDLMPVSSDGKPLGCDDTSLKFDVKTYKNEELVEESSKVMINCEDNSSSEVGLVLDNSGSVRDHRLIVNKRKSCAIIKIPQQSLSRLKNEI